MRKLHLGLGLFLLLIVGLSCDFRSRREPGSKLPARFSSPARPGAAGAHRCPDLSEIPGRHHPADMRRLRRKNLIPTSSYTPWMLELALREGNAYNSSMQYTLRNIPE